MKVVRVEKNDLNIVRYIIQYLIDVSNRRDELPAPDYLEKLLADDRTYLLAAVVDQVVVGYTLAYRFPSLYAAEYMAYLYDIEVVPEHRRKGIGKLLVETLIEYVKLDGVKELWLGTAVDNEEGQGLFSTTGGIKSGETFNDYTYYLD